MTYSIIVTNPPGIICMCEVDFNCPNCQAQYGEDFYMKQLQKSERGFIYKRCKKCGEKIGVTTCMTGGTKVWLKKDEH